MEGMTGSWGEGENERRWGDRRCRRGYPKSTIDATHHRRNNRDVYGVDKEPQDGVDLLLVVLYK